MSVFINNCFFCCQHRGSELQAETRNEEEEKGFLNQFMKLAQRYLRASFQIKGEEEFKACQNCISVVKSFCKLYHEWKRLEMEMEWKLRKLCDVITSADKMSLGSTVDVVNTTEDEMQDELFRGLRKDFQQQCILRFSQSFPRLVLKQLSSVIKVEHMDHLPFQTVVHSSDLFLGWISTLAVVLLLGSWFQDSSGAIQSVDQPKRPVPGCDSNKDEFEVVDYFQKTRINETTPLCNFPSTLEIELVPQIKSSEFEAPETSPSRSVLVVQTQLTLRKRKEFQEKVSPVKRKKRRNICNTNSTISFSCFCCSKKFHSFSRLQHHRRKGFTHNLMKLRAARKRRNRKNSRPIMRYKRTVIVRLMLQDEDNSTVDANVGILRPLRMNFKEERMEISSEEKEEQESSNYDDDDCSSSSISSGEEFELSTCLFCDKKFKRLQRHQCKCRLNPALESEFCCNFDMCKEVFKFEEQLETHKKYHGTFHCTICNEVVNYAPDLALHESDHMKQTEKKRKPTKRVMRYCARCNYYADHRACYINHYLKKHLNLPIQSKPPRDLVPKQTRRLKVCDAVKKCKKRFETESDLANHRKLHGKFACSICPVVESYAPKLAVHETTHVEPPSSVPGRRGQPYSCSRCASIFFGKFQFITHFLELHLNLPSESVTCLNCGDKFPELKELRKHSKTHHAVIGMREEDIVRCDQCLAFFIKPVQLAAHKKKMHGEDDSTCLDCGKKFANPYALRSHRSAVHKIKEADFLHVCDVADCERRFERVRELAWHKLIVHDGKGKDKSLVCHECGKKLLTKTAFASHMQLHGAVFYTKKKADPKRYVCEECGKIFKNQDKLNVHKLSHTGPASWEYVCLFCNKRSATEHKLMEHISTHTNEKPFICRICGQEYTQQRNLRDHMNKKHDANELPQVRKIVNDQESKKGQKLPPRLKK